MGKPSTFPTACRGVTSIVGQHTYAERFDFKGWSTAEGFCPGTENTKAYVYATTNDAMDAASFDYARYGSLDFAISELAGDMNPQDGACKWKGAANGTVGISVSQAGAKERPGTCRLTPGKMYYINVKPFGGETANCGSGPIPCLFSIYTSGLPSPSKYCR